MNISRLQAGVETKLAQWDNESKLAAARAIRNGEQARLVTYPTGLSMMRFAEPFTKYGMHYEVAPEVWNQLVNA